MTERLYLPTRYIESKEDDTPVGFLLGPIQGCPDWQTGAAFILHQLHPTLIVASPRRVYLPGDFVFDEQVDWETYHLNRAKRKGVVLAWLPKEVDHDCDREFAQTSRGELFEAKRDHERDGSKLVVGIEEGFTGTRYIRRRFGQDCPDIPICNTLIETCYKAVELLHK